jgi:hypothetical protein
MLKLLLIIVASVAVTFAVFLLAKRNRQPQSRMPHGEELNAEMRASAERAVETARNDFKVNLDYSYDSVERVEDILGQIRESKPTDAEERRHAVRFGAYVGEVMRAQTGGTWEVIVMKPDKPGLTGEHLVIKHPDGGITFTVDKAYKRLTNGEQDNVWFFYQVIVDKYLPQDRKRLKSFDLDKELKNSAREGK